MKYRLDIAPNVVRDARKIYRHREKERKGAGDRFVGALVDCYARIKANPYGYQIRKDPFRHVLLPPFARDFPRSLAREFGVRGGVGRRAVLPCHRLM